jgi:uncharacterized membrane protein YgcG
MARTNIAVFTTSRTDGSAPVATAADVANGNSTANDGAVVLVARNTDTNPHTLTVHITRQVDGVTPAAKTFSIAAGTTEYIGPFTPNDYSLTLTYDLDSSTVTILPLRAGS